MKKYNVFFLIIIYYIYIYKAKDFLNLSEKYIFKNIFLVVVIMNNDTKKIGKHENSR